MLLPLSRAPYGVYVSCPISEAVHRVTGKVCVLLYVCSVPKQAEARAFLLASPCLPFVVETVELGSRRHPIGHAHMHRVSCLEIIMRAPVLARPILSAQ